MGTNLSINLSRKNEMLISIFSVAFCFFFLLLIAHIMSYVETRFVKTCGTPIKYAVRWSLSFLKIGRISIFFCASIEVILYHNFSGFAFVLGILMLFVGMSLRIVAIKKLGPLWSYHACLFNKHHLVQSGIYKWLQHPAYIGNVHIPGLVLSIGAPFSTIAAFFLVVFFYLIRTRAEHQLLIHRVEISDV